MLESFYRCVQHNIVGGVLHASRLLRTTVSSGRWGGLAERRAAPDDAGSRESKAFVPEAAIILASQLRSDPDLCRKCDGKNIGSFSNAAR